MCFIADQSDLHLAKTNLNWSWCAIGEMSGRQVFTMLLISAIANVTSSLAEAISYMPNNSENLRSINLGSKGY